jgi:uncharacterized protein
MLILIHSSKTMHALDEAFASTQPPELLSKSLELATYIRSLSTAQIATTMKVSDTIATNVQQLYAAWGQSPEHQRSAMYSFAGDIFSGLQIHTWSQDDLTYANTSLRILSGLYGVLKPLDGIQPYRLEMGYRLPHETFRNLYTYWGQDVAQALPPDELIVDIAAKEYSKLVLPHLTSARIITPKFLTVNSKTGTPTFVVVHAKIARGAFAAWLVKRRVQSADALHNFSELGYTYDSHLSTTYQPVFVCTVFGGLGLSVRLTHK